MTAAADILPREKTGRRTLHPYWLAAPGLLFLAFFFVYPVLKLMGLSVIGPNDTLSFDSFHRIGQTDVYLRVLAATFRISLDTAIYSLVLGYPLAYWLSSRPESERGKLLIFVMVPFWTSYLVKTFAWMIILGHTGVINTAGMSIGLFGQPLDLLHNRIGVMVGMVHAMVPLAVMTMLPVMQSIDRRLITAAHTLGATPARAFWLVYFKLSLPGVTAAGLLIFISSLGFFIVPAFLGGRHDTMLAQLIITQVQEMLNWSFAGALSVLMVGSALIACLIYDKLFGLSTISGGAAHESRGALRGVGLAVLGAIAAIAEFIVRPFRAAFGGRSVLPVVAWAIIAFLVIPTLIVIPLSFTSSSFLEFPPPGYSVRWFETYYNSPVWISATVRSFGVATATAILATCVGGLAALSLAYGRGRWSGPIFAFFLAPMIVPRIVIAVGMFYLFASLGLIATDIGLVIGHTVLAIPFAMVTVGATLKTYDIRLDQAAATLGANRFRTVIGVTIPLIKGGVIAALLIAFITSFDELTIAIFVSGGITTTLPKQMWDDMLLQLNPTLAAVSVTVFVVVTALLLVAERFRSSSSS